VFASIDEGAYVDNGVMVAGYVVMRVAMVASVDAGRAGRPGAAAGRDDLCGDDLAAQAGWWRWRSHIRRWHDVRLGCRADLIELGGPYLAETRKGGTPGTRITSPSATG
jgi:hypothetical protein